MIDFHCHLDLYPDPHATANRCRVLNMYVLSLTTTPSAWHGTVALAARSTRIRTAIGLHPQIAHQRKHELNLFKSFLPLTRYVGEVGLDGSPELRRHWPDQIDVFEHILRLCEASTGKIISIHSRRAASAVLDCLSSHDRAGIFVLHWFSGTRHELTRAIEMGCWFSVGPAMLASKNGRTLASLMPRDRILTETDGPFAQIDSVAMQPWDAKRAVDGLASIWNMTTRDAEILILANLKRLTSTV